MTPQEKIIQDKASNLHDYYEIYSQEEKWKSQDLCRGKPFIRLPLANQKVMLRMAELWINEIEGEKKRLKEEIKKILSKNVPLISHLNDCCIGEMESYTFKIRKEVLALLEEKK